MKLPKTISVKHRKKLLAMPTGSRQVYCFCVCGICREDLQTKELEWCIDNEFLPVCEPHRKEAQERVAKLWGHLSQMSLL